MYVLRVNQAIRQEREEILELLFIFALKISFFCVCFLVYMMYFSS